MLRVKCSLAVVAEITARAEKVQATNDVPQDQIAVATIAHSQWYARKAAERS
jgi:hypothetical protein